MIAVEVGTNIEDLMRESGLPRHEAALLLRSALGCERSYLVAHAEDPVDPSRSRSAQAWFARRRSGEPVAYISGWREFYGLKLHVTPDVLIPRSETEHLVELALARLPLDSPARVLDLGTGSGAIAVALASLRPELRITATDVSEEALDVARRNSQEHAVEIAFVRSDWFESIGPDPFDLIVSNSPYVAAGDPHLERGDVRFEPRIALVGGDDGLACIHRVATGARQYLRPGGSLVLEHGYDQAERCVALLRELGYMAIADFPDLAGLPRVCSATWRG
jgi:release factor glutamine methyltransferase